MDLFGKKFISEVRKALEVEESFTVYEIVEKIMELVQYKKTRQPILDENKKIIYNLMKEKMYWHDQALANQRLLAQTYEQLKELRKQKP